MGKVLDRTAEHPATGLVGFAEQLHRRVAVFDTAYKDWDDPEALVWEYVPDREGFQNPSGLKLRHSPLFGGDVVIMCASGGWCGIVSYPAGELLYEVQIPLEKNVHSVELTPEGFFAIAASTGEEVRVYDVTRKDDAYAVVSAPGGHGTLWDPDRKLLFTCDWEGIRAWRLSRDDEGKPVIEEAAEYAAAFTDGKGHGHDLSAVTGNPDRIWVTSNWNVWQYDKVTHTLHTDYPEAERIAQCFVKGMGNAPDGMVARVIPNGTQYDWNTDMVDLFFPVEGQAARHEVRLCHEAAFYKSFVWNPEYM